MGYFQYSVQFNKQMRLPAISTSQLKNQPNKHYKPKRNNSILSKNASSLATPLAPTSSITMPSNHVGWNLYKKIMNKLSGIKSKPECPMIPPNLG